MDYGEGPIVKTHWFTAAILLVSVAASTLLAQDTDRPAVHVQSDAVKAFRQTAIPVQFPTGDLTLSGWVYKPKGDGPFPGLIWNHGSEQLPTAHPELGKFYTEHGFAVFLPVRRGHGRSPGVYIQEALEEFRKTGADDDAVRKKIIELHREYNRDVVAALAWWKQQPYVDPQRLVVTGCSYGGIQTLLTAEKDVGVRAYVPFAPGAMSWRNPEVQQMEIDAVKNARAPVFLLQARNDYNIGPSETLGPILRDKGGLNRSRIYPAFGATPQEGHGGFACWEEGIAIWGDDVLQFLREAGVAAK